jgi:hypothetical protein
MQPLELLMLTKHLRWDRPPQESRAGERIRRLWTPGPCSPPDHPDDLLAEVNPLGNEERHASLPRRESFQWIGVSAPWLYFFQCCLAQLSQVQAVRWRRNDGPDRAR